MPRPERAQEPVWRPSSAKTRTKETHELTVPPKSVLAEKAVSSGYKCGGAYTPVAGQRREVASEPKWNLTGKLSTVKPVHQLEPVPRRQSTGMMATRPVMSATNGHAQEEGEVEFDDDDSTF